MSPWGSWVLAALTFQQGKFVDGGRSQYRRIFLTLWVNMLSAGAFLSVGSFHTRRKR